MKLLSVLAVFNPFLVASLAYSAEPASLKFATWRPLVLSEQNLDIELFFPRDDQLVQDRVVSFSSHENSAINSRCHFDVSFNDGNTYKWVSQPGCDLKFLDLNAPDKDLSLVIEFTPPLSGEAGWYLSPTFKAYRVMDGRQYLIDSANLMGGIWCDCRRSDVEHWIP